MRKVQFFIEDWIKQGGVLDDTSVPLGQQYRRYVNIQATPPLFTRTNMGTFDLSFLELVLDISMLKERILLKDHLQYSNESRPMAYAAQGKLVIEG